MPRYLDAGNRRTESTPPVAEDSAGAKATETGSADTALERADPVALTSAGSDAQRSLPATECEAPTEGAGDDTLINAELSEVTANPAIEADRVPGQPTVLRPSAGEEEEAEPTALLPPAGSRPPSAQTMSPPDMGTASAAMEAPLDREPESPADKATKAVGMARGQPADGADEGEAGGVTAADSTSGGASSGGRDSPDGSKAATPGVLLGAADVPPPQPAALQAQLPAREPTLDEFLDMFTADRSPEQDQAELAGMLGALRAQVEAEKVAILAEAQAHQAAIRASAEAQADAVQTSAATAIAGVRAAFAAAHATLQTETAARQADLAAQIAAQIAQVEAESAAKVAEAGAQLDARQARIVRSATSEAARPQAIADQEAARAESELEAAAAQCDTAGTAEAAKYPGSSDAHPDKRAAAREVAAESAADIRGKKAPLAADIRSRAGDNAARYFEYADSIGAQVEQARGDLLPMLSQCADEAIASLQASETGAAASLEQRLAADAAALDAAEQASIGQIEAAQASSLAQINAEADEACTSIDTQAQTLNASLDASLQETEAVVQGGGEAFVPGMRDVIAATRAAMLGTASQGRTGLAQSAAETMSALAGAAGNFAGQMAGFEAAAQAAANDVVQDGEAAGQAFLQGQAEQGAQAVAGTGARQDGLIAPVLAQIDAAVSQAEGEMAGMTEQLADELHRGVDESIAEAILPRTDDIESRTAEAADQVDDAWWEGLLRALGQIIVGLVILVVVALVVAAIAAAFGVILTAWTAVMIAGAILLVAGFVMAVWARSGQAELADAPWYQVAGIALLDTIGYTGIHESVTGRDFVTDRTLSAGERTERGVMGAVTMISLALGTRAAFKGPPGGAFTRPNVLPRGWVGWRAALPQAWRGMRVAGIEMWQGTRSGARSAVEWVRTRLLGMEPTRPSPELLGRVGEPSNTVTGSAQDPYGARPNELPYRNPPEMMVASEGQPIDVSALDPNRTYLWAVDAEGRIIIAPEQQPGFGRYVKHGDLVPGAGGEFRGSARAGGELRARVNPQTGEVTWVMDSNSSYSFARTDQQLLGEASRTAAHELLSETGTDTSSIDVAHGGDGYTPTPPQPPRPGAVPGLLPARRPSETEEAAATP